MKAIWLIFVNCALVFGVEHVPVLMWGTIDGLERQVPELSSLSKLSSDDFSDILLKRVGRKSGTKPVIAVFVEENLSVEDFSWQDADGHAPFSNLENLTNAVSQVDFYPSVHSPLKGLKRLGYRWRNLQADHENEIDLSSDDDGTVLVVKLGDAKIEEDRPGLLKRHVNSICNMYEDLTSKTDDVVAVYTARHSSRVEPDYEPLVRRVRSVAASDDVPVIWNTSDILFYSAEPVIFSYNVSDKGKNVTLTATICTRDTRGSAQSLECRCNNNTIVLELRFNITEFMYWYLDVLFTDLSVPNTTNQLQLYPPSPIYAPLNFSYHCSPEVVFSNGVVALYLKRFQVQPYMSNKEGFGDSYDCVAFFSVPIWAGLMVSALLGLILVIGLAVIMDIHTMDRFDDPKGKTITINAAE